MITNILLKVKLAEGYLLKVLDNDCYEIHHINGNGIIKFNSKQSLLQYLIQINSSFDFLTKDEIAKS